MTDWNQLDSMDLLRPWLFIDPLTVYQAAMLICGRAPRDMVGRPAAYHGWEQALRSAIHNGVIPAAIPDDIWPDDDEWAESVRIWKQDLCAWLEKIDHRDAFFFLDDPAKWPTVKKPNAPAVKGEKPVNPRERSNMLRIIRALSVMAQVDGRGASGAVEKKLQELGFDSPKLATIRAVLDEAKELDP